ncbi:hypothetical protein EUX98_g4894 [Antrodiella citrinella]|uniref:O-methyltransferase C-terminal domain-containing protein n=1 Tax=Antrodiella citrinella TaxID=2447956 RepID=A0A4S4MUP7_9APHY|nr:hypothetical protein EUX98_g4894 [Antrodiella citrinella]
MLVSYRSLLTRASIGVALEAKIADLLKDYPQGLHVSEIALRCGIDEGKRLLRLLATKQCFHEVHDDMFANNRLSVLLRLDNPVSSSTIDQTAFTKAYDGYMLWDDYTKVAPEKSRRFGDGMIRFSHILNTQSMVHGFPWKDLPPGTTLCDLGSGVEYMSLDIARLSPDIRIVLQDQPETIEQGKIFWNDNAPEIHEEGRVGFAPIDFFKEFPDAIFTIHNWMDEASQTLLTNIKKVMKATSRIILRNTTSVDSADGKIENAPALLPPNYGQGRLARHFLDIDMMASYLDAAEMEMG